MINETNKPDQTNVYPELVECTLGIEQTMIPKTDTAASMIFVLQINLVGCSLVFTKKVPSEYHPRHEPQCTGCIPPILDGPIAIGLGISSVLLIEGDLSHEGKDDWFDGIGVIAGLAIGAVSILYLASTIHGIVQSVRCYDAREAHDRWLNMSPDDKKQFEEQWRKRLKKRTMKVKDDSKVESLAW